jgi:hypothetical protein
MILVDGLLDGGRAHAQPLKPFDGRFKGFAPSRELETEPLAARLGI